MIWSVVSVEAYPLVGGMQNVIYQVRWRLFNGQVPLEGSQDIPAPTDSFTPFEQLTEAQVLDWVLTAMGPEMKARHEAFLGVPVEAPSVPEAPSSVTLTLP